MTRNDGYLFTNNVVIEFLKSKGYLNDSILQEASVSTDPNQRLIADIILINESNKDYLAILEIKRLIKPESFESAKWHIHRYLQALKHLNIPGYIFAFDQNNNMTIYALNKDGIWSEIENDHFPNYNSLTTIEEKKRELSKTIKKKRNVDIFLWICIVAAGITCTFLILSICEVLKLDEKEMSLLLLTIGLVIIPFVAKLEILGMVFERKSEK
jgi:hypothetical protein